MIDRRNESVGIKTIHFTPSHHAQVMMRGVPRTLGELIDVSIRRNLTLRADVLGKALDQQRNVKSLPRDRFGNDVE